MTLQELQQKYANVPQELKNLKRWICYRVEGTEDGKTTKRPYNAISGKFAKVNDNLTWSTFNIALSGCSKYHCDGLGFVLGDGIFGIDLDNHPNKEGTYEMTNEEFNVIADEFIQGLDSYAEYSQSGKGIHIICYGKLPEGGRRKGCVEMYDSGRFFAFTGNVVHDSPINEREEQVKPLWEKYVKTYKPEPIQRRSVERQNTITLSDEEVIENAISSKNGDEFYRYYHDGDISQDEFDHSKADMTFCNLLCFWCNGDKDQMDRIFRSSALMRDKWDEYRGEDTYGNITLNKALEQVTDGYRKSIKISKIYSIKNTAIMSTTEEDKEDGFNPIMNIDEYGNPIIRVKKVFIERSLDDTGNALTFCDYFGDIFKYNTTDKCFMFWTGKTWIKDETEIVRNYADKLIEILKDRETHLQQEIEKENREGNVDKVKLLTNKLTAMQKNSKRLANKSGKDAMLSEVEHYIAIKSSAFNQDDYLLNTDSGIVDLRTGEILPFDKDMLCSKNTHTKVSYDTPVTWLSFLRSVFDNGNIIDTQELVDSMQTCLGYSLSGLTKEQVFFILYGEGSNGKSTLTEQIANILGDYSDNIQSSVLMQQKSSQNSSFSIAKLQTARFVETGETDEGGRLAEAQVKILTGGDSISAQYKYGNEFSYKPKFKIWMSTNNIPNIRGTDFGIWRRIFLFPFINCFTGPNKDKTLPEKLKNESDKILGWCIKGFLKYQELGDLIRPSKVKEAVEKLKGDMDKTTRFIEEECSLDGNSQVDCKALYERYKKWSQDNCEYTYPERKFKKELGAKTGILVLKLPDGTSVYSGLRMNGFNITGRLS